MLLCLGSPVWAHLGAQGPKRSRAPGGANATLSSLRQQLAGVSAQLNAVDAEIKAARAAGDVEEVSALREKERKLMDKENLLLRERSLLRGLDVALQPGTLLRRCCLTPSHRTQLSCRDARAACGSLCCRCCVERSNAAR